MSTSYTISGVRVGVTSEATTLPQIINTFKFDEAKLKVANMQYLISRHTEVCRAAQEAGAPHREYIDRKNENVIFTLLYLGDHLSDWNQISYTVARQPRESTFQI